MLLMPMNNLIEYSKNYADSNGSRFSFQKIIYTLRRRYAAKEHSNNNRHNRTITDIESLHIAAAAGDLNNATNKKQK